MLLRIVRWLSEIQLHTYHIVQKGGGVKHWQIDNFKNLVGKTLANCILVFFKKTQHSHTHVKTTIVYFIITCGAKIVCSFAVSSVVRG